MLLLLVLPTPEDLHTTVILDNDIPFLIRGSFFLPGDITKF